jgi:MFS superfamily sulfate permease-like transporter
MTQLPGLLGVPGGGHNFLERLVSVVGQLGQTQLLVLAIGGVAIVLLLFGERWLPGRPVALVVVALAIVTATLLGLPSKGVPITGEIPSGLPSLARPQLRLRDVEGIFSLAAGCLLLAYVEGVSAGRTFAAKHGYRLDMRQEFLGIGGANFAAAVGQGYPVAGGLSQSAVNDKAGAKTPLALIFASITLALCLLYLTDLLENLPTIALVAVLLLGILQGILLAALASVALLLMRVSSPHVAFLGRIPGTQSYSDTARHPENEPLRGAIVVRPEASLIYVNAAAVLEAIQNRLGGADVSGIRLMICDLSASPFIDLAGSNLLHELHAVLAERGIALRIVGARSYVRDFLRADGLGEKIGAIDRAATIHDLVEEAER